MFLGTFYCDFSFTYKLGKIYLSILSYTYIIGIFSYTYIIIY